MRFISNKYPNSDLIVILHGQYGSLNQPLVRNIFERLKDLNKKVVLFEFSYVQTGQSFDPDQTTEAKELKDFLKTQKHKSLTIIAHSNAIFITLVLWEMKVKIDGLVLLGFPLMQSAETPKEMALMLQQINNYGNICIIQAKKDEYTSLNYVRKFLKKCKLRIELLTLDGNHHFEGFEAQVGETVKKFLQ